MARRTVDETRQLLLETGLDRLYEQGTTVGVTHIKLNEVAAAAGLTTGAAYRCWENQDAFHHDLAVAAVRRRHRQSIASIVEGIRSLVDERAPWREVVRAGSAWQLESYGNDRSFVTSIALRACAPNDEELELAGRERVDSALANFAELYDALLGWYGHRMRVPYTVELLTMAIAALSEGFVLQSMSGTPHPVVRRESGELGVGVEWTLFGCIVEALVDTFTESAAATTADDAPPTPAVVTGQ